jgi:flagellar motor protein MotB
MSRFIKNRQSIQIKGICLMLVIGLAFFSSGCRSFSHKSPSAFQPVPTQPVPAQTTNSVQSEPSLQDPTQPVLPLPISTQLASTQPIPDLSQQIVSKSMPVQSLPIPTTSYRPPTFLELENQSTSSSSEKTMVFRPITPSTSSENPEKPIPENITVSPSVNNFATTPANVSADVDALNRRIAELEKALAENEKKAGLEEKQPTTVSKPPIVSPIPTSRWIPTINHPGVTVSSDGERVRIEITDQVLFQSGTWRLNPNAEELLRKIAGEIRANDPESSLEIEGHTDGVMSTDPANAAQKHDISSVKTMTIMEYFVGSLRWNATKIKTSNFGSSRPVADNNTSEGRARNNRIEIVILPKQ